MSFTTDRRKREKNLIILSYWKKIYRRNSVSFSYNVIHSDLDIRDPDKKKTRMNITKPEKLEPPCYSSSLCLCLCLCFVLSRLVSVSFPLSLSPCLSLCGERDREREKARVELSLSLRVILYSSRLKSMP